MQHIKILLDTLHQEKINPNILLDVSLDWFLIFVCQFILTVDHEKQSVKLLFETNILKYQLHVSATK